MQGDELATLLKSLEITNEDPNTIFSIITTHHYFCSKVLVTRRGVGRRLPPTPNKPSTLQLTPASINFPKLNASPTRNFGGAGGVGPMSFEQAVAIGRGGRILPSPVPNGLKPSQVAVQAAQAAQVAQQQQVQQPSVERHSDSDDDDWC
ncbi:Calcium channel [Nesidiocoris tenuis]|uniref:Calcium channel n=1 Tax=Nesidiocoris tenuis TaxID=355587 RepID=A0ABN7AQA0_9HEMI|nr:Calcium channel [Nesidiocoris tenuis]